MQKPNYSIIIPHKNIPNLLERCLDSIPCREDIQVIVVDDNSDPEMVDFEHFPGVGKPHVEVYFTKEGKGAGYARNRGMEYATGKWILFADADDYFNYCINDILDEYINHEDDVVFFKSNCLDSYFYTNKKRGAIKNLLIDIYNKSPDKSILNLRYLPAEPWGKIVRRLLILENNIKFDETSVANDTTFSYLVGFYSRSVAIDKRAIYCVTYRYDSLSNLISKNKIEERMMVYGKRELFLLKHNIMLMHLGTNGIVELLRSLSYGLSYFLSSYGKFKRLGFDNSYLIVRMFCEVIIWMVRKFRRYVSLVFNYE